MGDRERWGNNLQEQGGRKGSKEVGQGALKVAGEGRGLQVKEFSLYPLGWLVREGSGPSSLMGVSGK